jgi:hypothetical protein
MDDIIDILKNYDFICVRSPYTVYYNMLYTRTHCYLEVLMYPGDHERIMRYIKQYRTIKLYVGSHFNDIESLIHATESLDPVKISAKIAKYPMVYEHPKIYSSLRTLDVYFRIYERCAGSQMLRPTRDRWDYTSRI